MNSGGAMDVQGREIERYMNLLQAASLGQLFNAMTTGLARDFGLDAVTVAVRDVHHEVRQLLQAEEPHAEPPAGVLFVEALEGLAPQYHNLWQPWLGPFAAADHSLIFPGRSDLGSCALLPLRRNDELMGCLNFGSTAPDRFMRGDPPASMRHLADISSICVENAINRSRLVRSGITDVLTGLYNRRYLQHRLVDELARARRDRRPLACVMLDVDHFKPVNDRWGHPTGDRVLAQIAHVIREECRESDIPIRFGGEEFAVLLPGADVQEASKVAERIRKELEASDLVLPGGNSLRLTISAGVSHARPSKADQELKTLGDRLVAEADVQLYRAKSRGRNCVCGAAS